MATLGRACLILALAVAVYGVLASVHAARSRDRAWAASGRRAMYAVAGLTVLAFAVLEAAFLRSDFSFAVVATHSSTTTPTFYKAAAAWSSQEGSLLLWLLLLSLASSAILFATRRRMRDVTPWATAVLLGFGAFFAGLLVFSASPFGLLSPVPAEGTGLQPLLRHPSMMIHPPMLYAGYTLFTVPFAFAIGALIERRVDAEWITSTRRFALAAWLFLGIGILLGARWSYSELGWGGYWAWDPVENASLLPWLTGTAFLHSIMIQERRGMLKVWNVSLILGTGILAILGTFLVRSGILDSIHAFGASTLGVPFVLFIALLLGGSVALVVSRREALRSEHRLDSMLSREAVFLFNNVVLVAMAFVILFLTFFPLIAEAVTGEKRALGPPLFDRFTVPLTLALVLLSGIGPVIAWRRATPASVKRSFRVPVLSALVVLVGLLAVGGVAGRPLALGMFVVAAFVAGTVGQEFWRGARARRAMSGEPLGLAFLQLVRRNRRRYGGYVIHLGMAVLFVGVAASTAFQQTSDVRIKPGESTTVDGYEVRYVRATSAVDVRAQRLERLRLGADLQVLKDGRQVAALHTERGYYPSFDPSLGEVGRFFQGESTSEVGLDAGTFRDVWTVVSPDQQIIDQVVDGVGPAASGRTPRPSRPSGRPSASPRSTARAAPWPRSGCSSRPW
jgi:cytochrome c-type biogenesis protein CcmF